MGQISSINFKKSFAINAEHNDRTLPPSYLIDNEKGAECNRSAEQARELKNQIISEAKETYARRTGQRFQAKSYEWSAVCNIKPDTTMDDLERLAKHFNDKYGFQCYQIAIHRDEGYIDEDGKEQINHHAHLEFITLDKESGKNNYRRELITPKVLRRIQTETAEILQMQRGQDKRLSGAERIEPRKYAKQKEAEKAARSLSKTTTEKAAVEAIKAIDENEKKLLNDKEKSEYLERLRKQYKGKGLSAEFFRELGALKKDKETKYTQKELDEAIQKAVEADREKQKPINRREFEQQTTEELKSYAQATGQKPTISPFMQGLIAFLPKDDEKIKQLEKVLKDEQEKFKNFKKERNEQIFKIVDKLGISTENLKTYKDYDGEILKAIDDLKIQNNTLKTQNKALQEQNDTKDEEFIDPRRENASAVKFEPLNAPILPQNISPGKDYEITHDRGFEAFDKRLDKNELEKEAEKIASYEDVKDENGLIRYGNKRAKVIFKQIDDDGWNWDETEKDITKTFFELVNYHKKLKERQAEQERRPQTTRQISVKTQHKKDSEREF